MKTIWCLFSIANNYDQPENNLEAWWFNKPNTEEIAKIIGIVYDKEKGCKEAGMILNGRSVRWVGCDWRLEEVYEGKIVQKVVGVI